MTRSQLNPARFYADINLSDGELNTGDVTFERRPLLVTSGQPFAPTSFDPEGN